MDDLTELRTAIAALAARVAALESKSPAPSAATTSRAAGLVIHKDDGTRVVVAAPTKPPPGSTFDRFTDRSRKVLQLARQEAASMGHNYVGTEHILLALLAEGSGVAAAVLRNAGLTTAALRAEVLRILGTDRRPPSPDAEEG